MVFPQATSVQREHRESLRAGAPTVAPPSLVADLGAGAELRETHISWVLLFEQWVLKIKKPVNLGFVDFSTLELRRAACEAEVTLNARLAPGVYRGVVPILRGADGRARLGAVGESAREELTASLGGEVIDWAVSMRRLPDTDRADHRLCAGRLERADIESLARLLARFHAAAATGARIARFGSLDAVGCNVRENFVQARSALREVVTEREAAQVEQQQLAFLEENGALFDRRLRSGRIRDGHGDLRLEHVYFHSPDPPLVLDCIEFNERFRYGDVCSDVAFLSMDLAWHGRRDLAELLLAAYARESDDYDLYSVVDFYESYRAYVRAKICAIGYTSPGVGVDARKRLERDARRYLLLALAAERPRIEPPRLIAVGGTIASGKTTLAEALGQRLSAPVIESDRTRKALLGVSAETPMPDEPWRGAYSDDQTDKVYAELLRRAETVIESGRSVIVDASFRTRAMRQGVRQLSRALGVAFTFVECRVPLEVSRERLRERATAPSVSDGRSVILDDFLSRYEPVVEVPPAEHAVVTSAGPVSESLAQLVARGVLSE
ncbi:MAG TPA: AAA family ATPase [Polyangiaceae bacterium]|nr:AAA family ATPase [Polyangiaceae bacterium]